MAQPPPSRLALRGLLSLPYRLCNPPPAVGKVRSCGATPVLHVRLEDVLARRHLPPIGLKDFEEYLLYVERSPENLYFILWFKDYTARYHAWAQREKSSLANKKDSMPFGTRRQVFSAPPTPDPALAMFYLRAKQSFFTPNAEYELNIPSDVLAPFHAIPHPHAFRTHSNDHNSSTLWHSQSVHPDPAVFTEVAIETTSMLNESLKRFVRVAYTNVGSGRAICGIVAGCFFTLVAGVLPFVLTTGRWNIGPHGRWIRMAAFPGLWLGLTIFIASLQGICLMVYIFGDLRQLRKFELVRPKISRPMPMPISSPMHFGLTRPQAQSLYIPSRPAPFPEKTAQSTLAPLDSSTSFVPTTSPSVQFSNASLRRTSFDSEAEYSSVGCNEVEIDVSPAFFDDVPAPEGPATASCLHRPEYLLPPTPVAYMEPAHLRPEVRSQRVLIPPNGSPVDPSQSMRNLRSIKSPYEYGPTAGFIPDDYRSNSTSNLSDISKSLRSQKSAHFFHFDLLPANMAGQRRDSISGGDGALLPTTNFNALSSTSVVAMDPSSPCSYAPAASSPPSLAGAGPFLGRIQYKCNRPASPASKSLSPDKTRSSVPLIRHLLKWFPSSVLIPSFTAGVPAFAAPMTQIQSPVVKRAQWEVVVRAALAAAVIAGVLSGIAVGVVP